MFEHALATGSLPFDGSKTRALINVAAKATDATPGFFQLIRTGLPGFLALLRRDQLVGEDGIWRSCNGIEGLVVDVAGAQAAAVLEGILWNCSEKFLG